MRHAKKLIIGTIAAVAILAATVAAINLQTEPVAATNQEIPPAPTGVTVTNTADGVLVSWNEDQADIHRIAWAHTTEIRAAVNAGDWEEAVHFANTTRDADYTIKYLPEGHQYYIRVGAAHTRASGAAWAHPWQLITIGATSGGTPVQAPDQPCTPTLPGTPSPTSTPSIPLPTSTPAPTTNSPPVFGDGASTIRQVPENSPSWTNVGLPVTATDPDEGNTLIYDLSGDDAKLFNIDNINGQLSTEEQVSYDYETKSSYSVTVNATDSKGANASIAVTINLTDVNEAPVFSDGASATRTVPENSPAGTSVGAAVAATDPDSDTLTYTLSGNDAASFSIGSSTGQISTVSSATYDYETKSSYSLTVGVSDGGSLTDSIAVTVNLTDVAETTTTVLDPAPEPPPQQQKAAANSPPAFDGTTTTREVPENSGGNVNVGGAITATDPDDDVLTYTLSGTDRIRFAVNGSTGQITTVANENYDYEIKSSYLVHVLADDGNGGKDVMKVTINLTNVNEGLLFPGGANTVRAISEGAAPGTNVGAPVKARDWDGDTVAYTVSGTDVASFNFDTNTAQITTKAGITYDREVKASYSLVVTASDGKGETASTTVTINVTNVTNVNEAPSFDDGATTTRKVAENTEGGTNVGAPVSATDPDSGDRLTYSLWGTDAASFAIDANTGQISTVAGVTYDYEAKSSYSLEVDVIDYDGLRDSIAVTVNLTDVEEPITVTACETDLGTLTAKAWYEGLLNDANCKAHHQDTNARYFHFTVPEQQSVTISLTSWGELYVSKGTPANGWGAAPNGTYEQRREVRRNNGKLVHDSPHAATPENNGHNVTLTLAAGETYTAEAAGTSGYFNISITP